MSFFNQFSFLLLAGGLLVCRPTERLTYKR